MPDPQQLQQLWQIATEKVKKRVSSIALWQAMEAGVALDYEEGDPKALVIGLGGENYSRSGHLLVPEHHNLIDQILSETAQQAVTFRVVECGSLEEWKTYRIHEEKKRAAQMALATGQRPQAEPRPGVAPASPAPVAPAPVLSAEDVHSIDQILDRTYRIFTSLPHRTLSQSRARFVRDAAQMLAGAEGQLAATGMSSETLARAIDRAIDKIAVWGECNSTTVALEYLRCKERL